MDREINIKGYSENPQGTLLDWEGFTPSLVLDVLGSWGTAQWWSVCLVLMRSWSPFSGPGKQTARTPVENLRGPIRDTLSEAHFCVRKPSWGWSRRGWRRRSVPPVKSGPLYGAKAKCSLRQRGWTGCCHSRDCRATRMHTHHHYKTKKPHQQ